jgi:hypothetical protein
MMFLSSSMAEHSAVNRRVVGSSPTSGAKLDISKLDFPTHPLLKIVPK